MINLFNPPAIIRQHRVEKQTAAKSNYDNDINDHILVKQFYRGSNRLKGSDGRTYQYIDKDGRYVSTRVSPYSPFIYLNIEPGVLELCKALHSKQYLTSDSCQGHSDSPYRFVIVAFNTKAQLEKFRDEVNQYNLPVYFDDDILKPGKYNLVYDQLKYSKHPLAISDYEKIQYSKQDITRYFNLMFDRDYKEYHMLQMYIGNHYTNKNRIIQTIIRTFHYWFYYKMFNNSLTRTLTDKIVNNLSVYQEVGNV